MRHNSNHAVVAPAYCCPYLPTSVPVAAAVAVAVQLSFADATEYAGEFNAGMNEGHGVLTFNDKVRAHR